MTSHQCLICYEEFPEIEVIHPCPQSEDSHCCIPCFQRYLESKFESTYEGACPILTCVFCKSTSDKKCLISDDQLKQYCPSLYERYLILASSLLSIQCSNCHTRKTVFVSPTFNDTIQSLMPKIHDFDRFMVDLRAYDQGFISIRDFFDQITTTYCPNLLTSVDLKAWTVMRDVLLLVNNSERRANLHLRYIKFRPCVWSPCCNTAMCFRCKTKNYHEGLTCEEVTATQSNELLPCGQCGVALVKGDGCDSIVCVCGNRFSWSEELQRANLSSEFTTLFPHNTPDRCAEILCYPNTDTELFRRAAAWSKMHKEQFEQGFLFLIFL